MGGVRVVDATMDHVDELALTMNQCDKDEIWASGHFLPITSLTNGFNCSDEPLTILTNRGEVMAMCGVVPLADWTVMNHGIVWCLCSHHIFEHKMGFLRKTQGIVNRWISKYNVLENLVDVRHERSKEWLEWLGFTFGDIIKMGPDDMDFQYFAMRK